MTSEFLGLSDEDRYVVGRLAARDHMDAELLARLPQTEIDNRIPGARTAYQRRAQVAAQALLQLGIDPESPEYRAAAEEARSLLDHIDQLPLSEEPPRW